MTDVELAALRGVCKTYVMGEARLNALDHVSFALARNEYLAIMGPSGCGKSTLLNVLGCLDRPTAGSYFLGGEDVSCLSDDELSDIRGAHLGFIFQSYNLIPQLTVVENIEAPLYYQGCGSAESRRRAMALAERVGLGHRLYHKPMELSGGQQQRVGIARALANDPLVILADEPTGNLDSHSGYEILDLFDELHAQGKTIVMVTHDPEVGRRCKRVITMRDGSIVEDTRCA